jgi:hypothetical protein
MDWYKVNKSQPEATLSGFFNIRNNCKTSEDAIYNMNTKHHVKLVIAATRVTDCQVRCCERATLISAELQVACIKLLVSCNL